MPLPKSITNGLKGFVMGASDVVPGVSGGTMALILGIYERLLRALKSFDLTAVQLLKQRKFRQLCSHLDLGFLVSVGVGMVAAIVVLSHPLTWLLGNQPAYIWALFFGLIVASVVLLRKRIARVTLLIAALAALGIVLGFWVAGLVPGQTAATPLYFFLSGAFAICAMMLPGISGSFLLVILGKYEQVLASVAAHGYGDTASVLVWRGCWSLCVCKSARLVAQKISRSCARVVDRTHDRFFAKDLAMAARRW